jgi:hypothetical protein
MIVLLWFLIAGSTVLLALVTFIQTLYLESMRLRTRDLPSIRFFREELDARLGLNTERGASAFSFVKHSLFVVVTVLFCGRFDGDAFHWQGLAQSFAAAWVAVMVAGYGLPQLLYRRTEGRWVLPIVPFLKGLARSPLSNLHRCG